MFVRQKANEELASELTDRGMIAYAYTCDVTKPDQLDRVRRRAEINPDLGYPDILVCNAGILIVKPFLELTEAEIRRTVDVNLLGYFWV